MDNNTIKVYNVKLEQCLYFLGCRWIESGSEYGSTYWIFPKTEKALWIVNAFHESQEQKKSEVA